jgi:hypothetical protein
MAPELTQVSIPDGWKPALDQWSFPDADAVVAAYLDPSHPVHTVAVDSNAPGVSAFLTELNTALAGPAPGVGVSYPDGASATVVATLVGEALGGIDNSARLPLVGPVEVDAPSAASRSNSQERIAFVAGRQPDYTNPNPWHTDAGPWAVPCRWTVLGANFCDPAYADAPTDLVPLKDLLDTWTEDPRHLRTLRETDVDWRQVFDGIEPLRAPVLGGSVFRWLKFLLPQELEAADTPIHEALLAFDRHLESIDNPYQGYLSQGLVVQNNHQSIHRGPPIAEPELRRILKIKVGGVAQV